MLNTMSRWLVQRKLRLVQTVAKRVFILLLLWSSTALLQSPVQAQEQQRVKTTFSYIPDYAGSPHIRLALSKDVTATFLIDTGSSISQISEGMAARLQLTPQPVLDEAGKPLKIEGEPVRSVTLSNIVLGELTLAVPMAIVSADRLGSPKDHIDGVLGANMLQGYAALFDFSQHQITLWAYGKVTAQELEAAGMKDAAMLPLVAADTGVPFLDGKINDKEEGRFVVDTGGDSTNLTAAVAKRLHLKAGASSYTQFTFSGPLLIKSAVLTSLSFGSLTFFGQKVGYPVKDNKAFPLPMNIGMDILSRYRMLIDMPQSTAYFQTVPHGANSATGLLKQP